MIKKRVHIVVEGGLVQSVYADNGLDVTVMVHDLDARDNEEEFAETEAFVAQLPDFAKQVY